MRPGRLYRDVGDVIQKHAQANGFSVVKTYCGHGVHKFFFFSFLKLFFLIIEIIVHLSSLRLFHCAPSIPHYSSTFSPFLFFILPFFLTFFLMKKKKKRKQSNWNHESRTLFYNRTHD